MITLFDLLESRTEKGRGSKKGRKKYASKEGAKGKGGSVTAKKARARIYDTLKQARSKGQPGDIISTDGSDRLYVLSKASWGAKSSGTIAKGFTPGSSTPGSEFKSVKAHAARTRIKHGRGSKRMSRLYGPGAKNKIANSKKKTAKKKTAGDD
jgi:hypothetical protein